MTAGARTNTHEYATGLSPSVSSPFLLGRLQQPVDLFREIAPMVGHVFEHAASSCSELAVLPTMWALRRVPVSAKQAIARQASENRRTALAEVAGQLKTKVMLSETGRLPAATSVRR